VGHPHLFAEVTLFPHPFAISARLLPRRNRSLQPTLERPSLRVVGINLPVVDSGKESTKGLSRLGDRGAG
jgi:hypothetical protein